MHQRKLFASALAGAALAATMLAAPGALGEASHAGWPTINGCFYYSGVSTRDNCLPGAYVGNDPNHPTVVRGFPGEHNELLGNAGDATIYAGNAGDVVWGDATPNGPSNSYDELHGGAGNDWIYAAHGYNHIWTGAGNDYVMLVYGYGVVDCNGSGHKTLVMRKLAANRHWQLVGCGGATIEGYAV